MIRVLSKLFNIRPNEWPRLLLFYLMIFMVNLGSVWGEAIIIAAFLQQVGVESLPGTVMVISIISIPAMALYTAAADRVANDKLMIAILVSGALGLAGGLVLLDLGLPYIAYPLLYLITIVPLTDIYALHRSTYTNSFYDTRLAKRVIPILSTAGRVAGIVAGPIMPLLNQRLQPDQIVSLYLILLLLAALIPWLIPRLLKENKESKGNHLTVSASTTVADEGKSRPSYFDNLREGYRYVSQSAYLRWMAVATLMLTILLTLLNYQALAILQNQLVTTTSISNFTALLTSIASLILLPIQLFLLSRIIGWIGVGNANLIYPFSTLAVSAGLIIWPGVPTAGLTHINSNVFKLAFYNPIDTLLYNAVLLRVKGRARAFIGGLITPVGLMVGSGLLSLLQLTTNPWLLPLLIGVLVVAYIATALVIRRQYAHALIAMLEQEDFSFLLPQEASELIVADPATLNLLKKKLEESASPELTIFMAQLISQISGNEAIPILGQAARAATDTRVRSAILEVLVAADIQGEAIYQLYTDFLADPAGPVRQAALAGLEELAGPTDERFLSLAQTMLADPEIEVRLQVLPLLLRSNNPSYRTSAGQILDELLVSQDAHQRTRAVRVLGQIGDTTLSPKLITFLADPADEVRLEAALAMETLSKNKLSPEIITQALSLLSQLVRDPVERTRQAALVILEHLGSRESHPILVNGLTDLSPQVRATTVDVLARVGKSIIPTLHPQLDSPDPQLRKMATVALSRINREQFGSLVEAHITGNLLAIYRSHGHLVALSSYARQPSISVLQSALREQNQQLIDEIFYLLTAIHQPRDVKIIVGSLQSQDARVRANAVEALESLTTSQTAQLIAPLFEPELPPAQLLETSEEVWDMAQPDTVTVINQLITDPNDLWMRAFVTLALGEIGTALVTPALPEPTEPQQLPVVDADVSANQPTEQVTNLSTEDNLVDSSKAPELLARRRRPSDLLNALAGADEADQPTDKQVQPESTARRRPRPADLLDALAGADNRDKQSNERQPVEEKTPRSLSANLFDALTDALEEVLPQVNQKAAALLPTSIVTGPALLTLPEIEKLVNDAFADPMIDVRLAARAAKRMLTGQYAVDLVKEEGILLSAVEKIIFLKEVPLFQSMTIDQLKVLANVCEEELFEEDTHIFNQGDPGGALYVVVSGRVGIEQEKRKGSFARLANVESRSYFGEMNLFDNSPRSATAIALQDTLTLRLRREPLIALARQYPDLSLELINVLSGRLREANDRIAELTRTRTRELQKFYDKFD